MSLGSRFRRRSHHDWDRPSMIDPPTDREPGNDLQSLKMKKGRLANARGPSLGRKRPRRAAIACGYRCPACMSALHEFKVGFWPKASASPCQTGAESLPRSAYFTALLTDFRRGANSRECRRKRRLAPRAGFAHVDFIDEISREPVFTSVFTSKIRNCTSNGSGHCGCLVPAHPAKLGPNPTAMLG
jgi:hypothetical protein